MGRATAGWTLTLGPIERHPKEKLEGTDELRAAHVETKGRRRAHREPI